MPRYFFHCHDERGVLPDDVGVELADDLAAICEGEIGAYEMYAHDLRSRSEFVLRRVEVSNSDGTVLSTCTLPTAHSKIKVASPPRAYL